MLTFQEDFTMPYDASYAQYIDHAVLKPDTGRAVLKKFCDEAKKYHFASVAVNSYNIPYVAEQLKGSGVLAGASVGFPLGATTKLVKVTEAKEAIENGAGEIDMVMNIGALKDGDLDYVREEIKAVVDACHPHNVPVKVILEITILTDEEIVTASKLAAEAGADFVKTSSGFAGGGATIEAVRLMREAVAGRCQVKAATGINNRAICDAFLAEGVTRFGTSKGIKIVEDID